MNLYSYSMFCSVNCSIIIIIIIIIINIVCVYLYVQLLREQIARHRVGTTDEGIDVRHFPAYEKESLVQQLETVHSQVG